MATAKQLQRRAENKKYLENKNVRAALEMISKSEGTNGDYKKMVYGTVSSSPLFPQLAGKKNVSIPNLARYPQILVKVNSSLSSSAAGKFQIIRKTYAAAAATMGLDDFSEETQDLLAVELIRQRGALNYIINGDIEGALTKTTLNKEWASLSGAGYGQHENKLSDLIAWFHSGVNWATKNPGTSGGGATVAALLVAGLLFF